jgi:hypothetical protein
MGKGPPRMKNFLASLGLTTWFDWVCMVAFAATLAAFGIVILDALP